MRNLKLKTLIGKEREQGKSWRRADEGERKTDN